MTQFRISCHNLEIERGRYEKKIPVEQRICKLCHADIENETTFLLDCAPLLEILHKIENKYLNYITIRASLYGFFNQSPMYIIQLHMYNYKYFNYTASN